MFEAGDVVRLIGNPDVGLVVKTMWFRDLAVDREGYLVTIHWLRTGGVLTYNTLGSGEHLEKVHD